MQMLNQTAINPWTPLPMYQELTVLKPVPKINSAVKPDTVSVTLKFNMPKGCLIRVPMVTLNVLNDKTPGKSLSKIELPPSLIEKKGFEITMKISLLQVVKTEILYRSISIVANIIQKKWFGKQKIHNQMRIPLTDFNQRNKV